MTFGEPALLGLLLLAPLAAGVAALLWRRRLQAIRAWAARGLWSRLLPGYRSARLGLLVALLTGCVAGIALGLARPRWGIVEQEVERKGVQVVLVLDSSLSMAATDVVPSRLEAAKVLVRDLLDRLGGHRFALVQAEGEGEVLAPLTLDRQAIDLLLASIEPASLLTPGTHLDAGLRKAAALFPEDGGVQQVVVLISDGEDHGGRWDEVVRQVAATDLVVFTLGVGTPAGSALPSDVGSPAASKIDDSGEPVVSRLQPRALEELAEATGGRYLQATSAGTSVAPLAEAIGHLAAGSLGTETVRQQQERFQWFLAPAAALLAILLATSPVGKAPEEGA